MNNIKITVDYLNKCKDTFMNGSDWSFERKLGITEIIDQLDGINEKGHSCYVSYLFSQLSDKEKSQVMKELDFYVDFDGLYSCYEL